MRSAAWLFKWSSWDLEILEGFVALAPWAKPSHTQQCKAPVMDIVLPCIYLISWGDTFVCHRCWKYWRWAWGVDSGEKETWIWWTLNWPGYTFCSLLGCAGWHVLMASHSSRCQPSVRNWGGNVLQLPALPELHWIISHSQPALS